jgi:hypothetical protein
VTGPAVIATLSIALMMGVGCAEDETEPPSHRSPSGSAQTSLSSMMKELLGAANFRLFAPPNFRAQGRRAGSASVTREVRGLCSARLERTRLVLPGVLAGEPAAGRDGRASAFASERSRRLSLRVVDRRRHRCLGDRVARPTRGWLQPDNPCALQPEPNQAGGKARNPEARGDPEGSTLASTIPRPFPRASEPLNRGEHKRRQACSSPLPRLLTAASYGVPSSRQHFGCSADAPAPSNPSARRYDRDPIPSRERSNRRSGHKQPRRPRRPLATITRIRRCGRP